ncbi:MAG: cytochrome C oxidase subunit II [Deltaproteobacteria bacterium]|nr:cytochrome C oxidase subunit II [Deltaproteobacteria bacterium]
MFDRWLPVAASSYAQELDGLMVFISVVVGVWFIAAEALLIYSVLRFRRKPGVPAAYLPGRSLRAMMIVLIPCSIVFCLDIVIDLVAAPIWHDIKEELPPQGDRVRITGEQWAWRFTYPGADGEFDTPDDFFTVNELRVVVDRNILFELRAKDVVHSLWIPELRLKQDAVPGRVGRGWFRATREGRYEIPCAEICGFGHTIMKGHLTVESQEAHRAWRAPQLAALNESPVSWR